MTVDPGASVNSLTSGVTPPTSPLKASGIVPGLL